MKFVEILQSKTKEDAIAFVTEQLAVRAMTRIDELSNDTLKRVSHVAKSKSMVAKYYASTSDDRKEDAEHHTKNAEKFERIAKKADDKVKVDYKLSGYSTGKPEGKIHVVGKGADLAFKNGHVLDDGGEKYGPTGTIKGDDGSVHHIYSAHGSYRVRPVGSTSKEQTEKLVKHLGGTIEESVEQINEYHAVGKVGDKTFRVATDDDYGSKDKVAKQNPHLNKYEVEALHAHLNSDGFENDEVHSSTQNNIRVSSNSGGYYGDFSDSREKMGLKESVDYTPGKQVYTSHTDKVLKGTIVKKDSDDPDQFIVNIKGTEHSVHVDHIHSSKQHASYMHEGVIKGFVNDTPFRLNLSEEITPQLKHLDENEIAAVNAHLVSEEFKEDVTASTVQGEFEVATSK